MSFKIGNVAAATDDGIPYLWGSGDETTVPSNEVKIKPSDAAAGDSFGRSVAVGCGRIVVGADDDDDNGTDSGSAYIFDLNGTQIAKIKPSDGGSADYFGQSVAIGSGRIVVSSHGDDDVWSDSGAVYIFDLNGTQLAKIKASDPALSDAFGSSVAVGSARIVVGAEGDDDNGSASGSAYIFDLNGTQLAKIKPSDGGSSDYFGNSVAVGCGRIVVGAYLDDANGTDSGSAYIFDLNGTQLKKINAVFPDGSSDYFGHSVAVGCGRIVVGAFNADGAVGVEITGAAYIYDLNGTQLAKIRAPEGAAFDSFGRSVAVGSGRIVVGADSDDISGVGSNVGSAYIFDLNGTFLYKIVASDAGASDGFGESIAVNCGRIVVGVDFDSDNGAQAGAAYIYTTPLVYTPYDVAELNSYGQ